MKLDPTKRSYDCEEYHWVAHKNIGASSGSAEEFLIQHRYEIEIIGGIQDNTASYSYDDWALCELKGKYYMLSTSGCSCPSPTETWRIEKGPATLTEIRQHILNGDYEGYTMPKKQEQDFIELLQLAESCQSSK